MTEQEQSGSNPRPLKDTLDYLEKFWHGLALDLEHAVYLARDLEAAANQSGICETHPDIDARIRELRKWLEDHFGDNDEGGK